MWSIQHLLLQQSPVQALIQLRSVYSYHAQPECACSVMLGAVTAVQLASCNYEQCNLSAAQI
jgi:hypothetical protein